MNIYAAINPDPLSCQPLNAMEWPHILCSFAYKQSMEKLHYRPANLTLDSGAFTAWSKGRAVDIHEYVDWALMWQERHPQVTCVNLDVIPGEVGRTSTAAERKAGMAQSLKNADFLRSKGLRVVEVFHMDEPRQFLDDLLARVPEGGTLALSPRNDRSVQAREAWLKVVLRHLVKSYPLDAFPRFHGLAVTAPRLLRAFPFHSGDSSTWKTAYTYGVVVNEHGTAEKIAGNFLPASPRQRTHPEGLHYATHVSLRNTARLARDITSLWARRGVTFDD